MAPVRQDAVDHLVWQRFGDDDETAHRNHAPLQPRRHGARVAAGGDQHLLRPDDAAGGVHIVHGPRDLVQFGDRSVFTDDCARGNGRPGQAMRELPDVESCSQRVEHRSVIEIGADFAVNFGLRDGGDVVVGQGGQLFLRFQHSLVVGGVKGQRQFPEPLEVAVDAIVVHQFFDGVDGIVVLPEHLHRTGTPVPLHRGVEADRQSRGRHPSVAAGCAPPDRMSFEDSNARTLVGEFDCRGEPGESGADNGDVDLLGHRCAAVIARRLSSIQPVRDEFHD